VPPRITHALVVFLGHAPLVAAVAAVAVGARIIRPVDDAAQVRDKAAQDGLRGDLVVPAQLDKLRRQGELDVS
jgi:hypothetical protein